MTSGAAKSKSSEGKTNRGVGQQQKEGGSVKSSGSKDSLPATKEESDPFFSSVSQESIGERETSSTIVTPPMQFRPLPVANLSMTETDNSLCFTFLVLTLILSY